MFLCWFFAGNNGNAGKHFFGGEAAEGRVDNGYHGMFPYDRFMNYLRAMYTTMLSEGLAPPLQDVEAVVQFVLPVRLKVVMEEPYYPMRHNLGLHNSKESTGLVGLENLGATCYLNALLQVRFCLAFCRICSHLNFSLSQYVFCRCCTT